MPASGAVSVRAYRDNRVEIAVDVVVSKSAAELRPQIASGPVIHAHHRRWRRIESGWGRKPAQIGSGRWRDAECGSRNPYRE
jgi:hypothetical protein